MDKNIQDKYYNKYLKYKTKYLELKELNNGVLKINASKESKESTASTQPIKFNKYSLEHY